MILLIFCLAFLGISVYFIFFSQIIGGDYRLYNDLDDFVNMASFAFAVTTFTVVLAEMKKGTGRALFLSALSIFIVIMIIVISVDRYLVVYPASGMDRLFFYVSILDFIAACILPFGLWRSIRKKYDWRHYTTTYFSLCLRNRGLMVCERGDSPRKNLLAFFTSDTVRHLSVLYRFGWILSNLCHGFANIVWHVISNSLYLAVFRCD